MEMDYNFKMLGQLFKALWLSLAKIVYSLSWFALLAQIHLMFFSWCSRTTVSDRLQNSRIFCIGPWKRAVSEPKVWSEREIDE